MIDFLRSAWPYLLTGFYLALASGVTLHAVLKKPETPTVIAWVGLAWLAPIVGSLAYVCLGVNRIQRRATSLRIGASLPADAVPALSCEDARLRDELIDANPALVGLANLGERLTGKRLLPGNSVTLLHDGDEAYPAMLAAVGGARRTIGLLSYIFDSDPVGERFLEALVAAVGRGVEVRVLIDSVGADYSKPTMVTRLQEVGVPVAAFLPTRAPRLFHYANMRNHRKILVVDGRIGFTGGTNIRIGHELKSNPKSPVQCAHFRIEGPVVQHIREAFAMDWAFTTEEVLPADPWFPDIERSDGFVGCRGIAHGPDEDFEHLTKVILGAIAVASHHIRIVSPYFLPDPPIVKALKVAALRGIRVDIVLPSHNNVPMVEWAAMHQLALLIENGCHVTVSAPPFDHTKLLTVDGLWALIGSTNWDPRSLRLNFEFNIECYSKTFTEQLDGLIGEKLAGGRELTLAEIENRSFLVRLRDGLARLVSPYL